jgi:hypothetical protein
MSQPPSIVDGPLLVFTKATELDMPCPKCGRAIRVTKVEAGAVIECPHSRCKNVTWRPEYVPPWWARTRNFAWSLIGSFILGFAASFFASIAYEHYSESRNVIANPDSPPAAIEQP